MTADLYTVPSGGSLYAGRPAPGGPVDPGEPGEPVGLPVHATIKAPSTGTVPFAFGQAFARGAVPAGVSLGAADLQVSPLATWDDGSLRTAVVAGARAVVAGTPLTISMNAGITPGSALTTAGLSSVVAAFTAGAFGGATFSGSDWSSPERTWVTGPLMSSWLYRKPIGSDAHLVAWIEVRLWAGGAVEVLPWVENGYLKVAGPINKSAVYTFSLGGTERFSATIDLPNHCRTPLVSGAALAHWLAADPGVIVQHDLEYLQATEMVPSYYATVPANAAVVTALPTTYTPLQQGGYPIGMGAAGYHGSIGLLPVWDVVFLTCPSSDLPWSAIQRNAYSAGRYGIHHRDEATNRPIRFSQHPTLCLGGGSGVTGLGQSSVGNVTTPATGTVPEAFKTSHHPSMGYLAGLITGRCYHVETVQFLATVNYMKSGNVVRQNELGVLETYTVSFQTRGAAWAWRTLAQVASLTPDADPLAAEFAASLSSNVNSYHARYVAQPNNPQGFVRHYSSASSSMFVARTWMDDFFTMAVGYTKSVKPKIGIEVASRLEEFFEWKAQSIVGRFGNTGATEFLYRDMGPYDIPMAPAANSNWMTGGGPWFAHWGQVWDALQTTSYATGPKEIGDGSGRNGRPLIATDYVANLTPALSYAVRHEAEGAAAALAKLMAMPEWSARMASFNANPTWGVKPAEIGDDSPPPPDWLPAPGYSALVPEVNTYLSARPPTPTGTRSFTRGWRFETSTQTPAYQSLGWTNFAWSSVIDAFSGGVYNPYYQHTPGRFGCLLFHGGGHSATNWNGIAGFDFNSGTYFILQHGSELIWPELDVLMANTFSTGVDVLSTEGFDGQPGAPHSYDTLVILGPEQGYPQGALITCVRASYFHSNASNPAVHIFDCANKHLGWQRKWIPPDGAWKVFTSGYASALDPVRNVVWTVGGGANGLCSFDLATNIQTKLSVTPGRLSGVNPETHTLRYIPGRNILLYSVADSSETVRLLQWLDPANPAGGWKTASLSALLPPDVHPMGMCWVPPKNALYIRCKGFRQKLFKVELPAVLTDQWTVTDVPFSGPPLPDMSSSTPGTLGRRFEWSEPLGAILYKAHAADQMMVYVPE